MATHWSQPSLSRDFARLSAVILFALLLASIWVSYVTFADHSDKLIRQLEIEVVRIDRSFSMEIESHAYTLESLGRQLMQEKPDDLHSIARLIQSFAVNPSSPNVFAWIDTNQQLLASSNRGILERPVDLSDRDYVKKAMAEPWKVQIGRPIEGRISQRWVIPMAIGLTNGMGKFVGVLGLGVDISALTGKISQLVNNENISFALSTLTFSKVGQHAPDDGFFDIYFPKEKLAALDLEKEKQGVFSKGSLFDVGKLYSVYHVSTRYPYIILVGHTAKTGKGPIHSLLWPRLLQLVVMACFLMALLWIIRLRIIRPVIDLASATACIPRGQPFKAPQDAGAMEIEMLAAQISRVDDYIKEKKRIEDELLSKALAMRKQKEAAEFSNRIKVEFLASMKDSITSPLHQIILLSEQLREGARPQLTHEQAEMLYQSAQRLSEVINDILALSENTAGVLEVKDKPMKIGSVLTKCIRLLQEQLIQRRVQVKTALPSDLPRLLMDELRMKQMLIHLILSSVANTPPGGSVSIEVKLESDNKNESELILSFVDSGIADNNLQPDVTGQAIGHTGMPLLKALLIMNNATMEIGTRNKLRIVSLRFPKERLVFLNN